jgi:hypothetical protein
VPNFTSSHNVERGVKVYENAEFVSSAAILISTKYNAYCKSEIYYTTHKLSVLSVLLIELNILIKTNS